MEYPCIAEPYRAETVAGAPACSYVDWPAIFAGTALAVALSFVLLTFGSAIGLSVASFEPGEGASLLWLGIASGIWFIWVAITSFAAGGYLAGRLRRPVPGTSIDEIETRDGAHGVLVWATAALVGAAPRHHRRHRGDRRRRAASPAPPRRPPPSAVGGDVDYLGARRLHPAAPPPPAPAAPTSARTSRRSSPAPSPTASSSPEDRDYLVGHRRPPDRPDPGRGRRRDRPDHRPGPRQPTTKALDAAEQARVAARHRRLRHRRHADGQRRHRLLRRHHRRRPPRPQHAVPHLRPLTPTTLPPRNCPPPLGGGLFTRGAEPPAVALCMRCACFVHALYMPVQSRGGRFAG